MTVITKTLLKQNNSYKEDIKFFENNFPEELFPNGLNLDTIKVTGDYKGYFEYINTLSEIAYDDNNNSIEEISPDGNIPQHEYDSKGNCIKEIYPKGYIYQYEYDDNNNLIEETYPNGNIYQYEYDSKGNLIKEIYPNGYIYEYDSSNNCIKEICSSGNIYQYEYDSNRNRIKEIFPDGRVCRKIFKYDSIGRLIQAQDCFIEYL